MPELPSIFPVLPKGRRLRAAKASRPAFSRISTALIAAGLWLLMNGAALAQVPAMSSPGADIRGEGFYFSLPKFVAVLVLFFIWVATADWVNRDCQEHRFNYALWNPLVTFVFAAALLLFFVLPSFWVGFPLLVLAYLGPVGAYVWMRNGRIEEHQRVLTPGHLRYVFASAVNKIGIPMEAERKDPHEKGKAVKLTARGAPTDRDNNVNLLTARQSPAFPFVGDLLVDAFENRADGVLFDVSSEQVGIKFQVDGVWHDADPQDREMGDLMIAIVKQLANLNPNERVKPQRGVFGIEYKGTKYHGRVSSQGISSGERVIVIFDPVALRFTSLDELGMRPKMQEQLKDLLQAPAGLIIFSSLPGGGLTATVDTALRSIDRYIRNFVTVEDERNREREIENLHPTTYNAAKGETPATVLPKLIRTYPDVIVVRDPVNLETMEILCEQPEENRVVIIGVRAKEAAEALLRVLAMKVPADKFAPAATGVVNQRLIRKLCESCKEAYPPPAELLKQMGIPASRLESIYRPPQEPERVCPDCGGVGYLGRTAVFELLVVDDTVRQLLKRNPKVELVRQAARKAGMKTLQEEGLLLVAKGTTSVQELVRVLKQ